MKLDNFIKVETLEREGNTRMPLPFLLHMKLKMWYAYKHMLAADICQPENLEDSPHSPINAVVTKRKDCTISNPISHSKKKKNTIALAIYMFGS